MGKFRSFLTGSVLGVIGGILIAPKKGEETRKALKEESEKLGTTVSDVSNKVNSVSKGIIEKVKIFLSKG